MKSTTAQQIAEAQFRARQNDLADQAAKEFIEEHDAEIAPLSGSMVSPTIEEESNVTAPCSSSEQEANPASKSDVESEPKPRKMQARFLRRGAVWCRARKVKRLRPGENVNVRNADGEFVVAGKVSKEGSLPVIPMGEY